MLMQTGPHMPRAGPTKIWPSRIRLIARARASSYRLSCRLESAAASQAMFQVRSEVP